MKVIAIYKQIRL